MIKEDVYITGMGIMSSIGNNKEEFWNALINGEDGVVPFTKKDYPKHPFVSGKYPSTAGLIKNFNPDEHFTQKEQQKYGYPVMLILKTVEEALNDRKEPLKDCRVMVIIGSATEIRPEYHRMYKCMKAFASGNRDLMPQPKYYRSPAFELLNDSILSAVFRKFNIRGDGFCIQQICSSGTGNLFYGNEFIKSGQADIVICISYDIFHPMQNILFFNLNQVGFERCRSFDSSGSRAPLAEGVGVAVLEKLDRTEIQERTVWGRIRGAAITNDAYHIVGVPPKATEFSKAITLALEEAQLGEDETIDFATMVGKGLKKTDAKELMAVKSVFGEKASEIGINSILPYTGYAFSASTMASIIVASLQMKYNTILPIPNFSEPYPEFKELNYVTGIQSRKTRLALVSNISFTGVNQAFILQGMNQETLS